MRSFIRPICSGICLIAILAPAFALVTFGEHEEFGPAREKDRTAVGNRLAPAYLPGRVYLLQKHWSGFGHNRDEGVAAYQGDVEAANGALATFANLPSATVREIHLLPAPGVSRSLKQKVTQACDFEVRWSYVDAWDLGKNKGPSSHHQATLVIYIDRAAAPGLLDGRAPQWIADLSDARFTVRQAAFDNLEKQRDAALPVLRAARDAKDASLEARRRIEQLLKRLEPIHAARLQLPKSIPVFGPDELLEREAQNWRSGDLARSWHAAEHIAPLAEFTEESLPLLVEMLSDGREQVRDLAVLAFQRLGSRAAGAIPALKAAALMKLEISPSLQKALAAVTTNPPVEGAWRENRQRRAEIAQFLLNLKKR
jgi:hypothetical protein